MAAVRLLYETSFPARVHLICHLIRDIYRTLPAALGQKISSRPVEVFPDMVKELVQAWQNFPTTSALKRCAAASDIPVSAQVHECLMCIIKKSEQMSKQQSIGNHLAVALFRSIGRRSDEFIQKWIIDEFNAEYDFFVKRAHLVRNLKKVPDDNGLVGNFEKFERAFHSLVGPYFTGKEELDDILQDTNTTTD